MGSGFCGGGVEGRQASAAPLVTPSDVGEIDEPSLVPLMPNRLWNSDFPILAALDHD